MIICTYKINRETLFDPNSIFCYQFSKYISYFLFLACRKFLKMFELQRNATIYDPTGRFFHLSSEKSDFMARYKD